ncbi:uncharacterized protein CTHT_0012910 [Thermochaetoides thermophila DSM 1495]|uniref:Uncharacterized protein n=1 Tax=Chaetomium thermophilum (strain DSM 1495 / CBS 144.50 / IMI 039719) TaxID=759272 RepID=G0S1A5_CHATD|nr:hypothetical protein CTHT_0012910 [Thermochaetoides thermophila DSM 1495]EGS22815.1 hypothetical protein CTHT_0012910 [Thermochaetoides thermophila DSM 1495]
MATIEPRLIHLLNGPEPEALPPIQQSSSSTAAPGPPISLPPLEPELKSSCKVDIAIPTRLTPRRAASDDHLTRPPPRSDDNSSALLTASVVPLQLLLSESEPAVPGIPLSKIVDDVPPETQEDGSKKRHLTPNAKDDFVQLPKLPKKRKSTQQLPPIVPPLVQPPPDPAVFPPIASAPLGESETFNFGSLKDFGSNTVASGPEDRSAPAAVSQEEPKPTTTTKPKRRAMKPRKKWTEEETNNLLLGVSRYGVGRWTSILEDPDFEFNGRTAGDLKDRFRTCCPDELRVTTDDERPTNGSKGLKDDAKPKNKADLGNILIQGEEGDATEPSGPPDSDEQPKRRKSRTHRKKLEDLAQLGIHGPFEKSHRRKRRPFTQQDDDEILDGLRQYGASWSRIQRDPNYHLSSRQPTDLRDRVRNKYPEIYAQIEKANMLAKEAARAAGGSGKCTVSASVLEPLINNAARMSLDRKSYHHHHLNRSRSKEEMPVSQRQPMTEKTLSAYGSTESLPALNELFDLSGNSAVPGSELSIAASAGRATSSAAFLRATTGRPTGTTSEMDVTPVGTAVSSGGHSSAPVQPVPSSIATSAVASREESSSTVLPELPRLPSIQPPQEDSRHTGFGVTGVFPSRLRNPGWAPS